MRLLGASPPNTRARTIVGTANAATAQPDPATKLLRFITMQLSTGSADSRSASALSKPGHQNIPPLPSPGAAGETQSALAAARSRLVALIFHRFSGSQNPFSPTEHKHAETHSSVANSSRSPEQERSRALDSSLRRWRQPNLPHNPPTQMPASQKSRGSLSAAAPTPIAKSLPTAT